ncbi:Fpg/Nei family DNA glycosylase [Cellulomonas shaoxiangyii]|uniref:DNA-(apurinic or apyrimidinic site) lyase n=1 Tax=Cellulomonas shaoxiangyii TaxID=2566013 RepID=A0A4P7SFU2_9CELL|nr:DNA-formamidopyrimidine glycosylase family protein [Cellulomonas shaoxiangyii]QCB92431.1 Fpg/Nei family DNA glycosylase [Cellulomonas shaoxiangyii]TGY85634.1 Fpg/Nei family DNA glycosylase [Cellulomonas shaoxiangyii]
MPEGHTVHRIARQLTLDLVGRPVSVSSPQGRFADGAARLDGRTMLAATAVGKQLFCPFDSGEVLRVHLGLYGAWDLYGQVSPLTAGDATRASLGAPRVRPATRLRVGEDESEHAADDGLAWPPPPLGQVRVRLATDAFVADLRGPSACEVLTPDDAAAVRDRLGPDPVAVDDVDAAGEVVVERVTGRGVAVGQLLMDQSVVAGIGNIYRAELLFRARLDPWTPGRRVPAGTVRALWRDWAGLLADGIRDGVMLTREDLDAAGREAARHDPALRHWVYGRGGLPCRVCGTPVVVEDMAARRLYRCPACQV